MVNNLHVIIVNDFAFVNGGASNVAITSALALNQAGHSVSFFSAVKPVMPALINSQINLVCLDQYDILNDPNRLRAIRQGLWNIKAAQVMDGLLNKQSNKKIIVHIHGFVKALSASFIGICHQHNVPIVLTLHDYFVACPNGGFYDYQQQQICLKKALSFDCLKTHCDVRNYTHKLWRVARNTVQNYKGGVPRSIKHFIYISELSKHIIQPYLPKSARLHYVPNPIDVIKTDRIKAENNQFYLFIGRLSPEKGVDLFCQVIEKLNCPAIVIGEGDMLNRLKKTYPNIEFTGWLEKPKIICIMNQAKALVFPTHLYETQGLVVYEALAQGIPVIVPEHCCAAEAVEHGKNGFLYNNKNKWALKLAIQQFEKLSKDKIKNLSKIAFMNYWYKKNTINQHIDYLLPVYNILLQ